MEVILVTSNKDAGVVAIDMNSGLATVYKDCIAESGCMTTLTSSNSYSGSGSVGDYIVIAQSKKPVIHVWEWSSTRVSLQCHQQEILTSLVSSSTGGFLFAGSKTGRVYMWEVSTGSLLHTWQAHFKAITTLRITTRGDYLLSASDDGVVKAWEYLHVFSDSIQEKTSLKNLQPFRSWNPHSLPVTDMQILGSQPSSTRVVSCSLDKHLVLYDMQTNRICYKLLCTSSLTCLIVNSTFDMCFIGTSDGQILIVDLSIAAIQISAAHATLLRHDYSINKIDITQSPISMLVAHTRCVCGISMSLDNRTLVTGSEDGSVKIWDTLSRQCIKELTPMHKNPITNIKIVLKSELLGNSATKSTLEPIAPFKKYLDSTPTSALTTSALVLPSVYDNSYTSTVTSSIDLVRIGKESVLNSQISMTSSDDRKKRVRDVLQGDFVSFGANDGVELQFSSRGSSSKKR